ncbi:MAG: Holliday junction branch migration protein RuvA [Anaerolineae bacterium]
MIARLTGRIDALEPDALVVDVGGVGYRVFVPLTVLAAAGAVGEAVTLHTHLHVREAELTLYGALDAPTLAVFQLVQTVSGVGPRVALAMLSTYDAPTLQSAIAAEDVDALVGVPGIGRKIAQRIVLELKPKVMGMAVAPGGGAVDGGFGGGFGATGAQADAIAALTALGYTAAEARQALGAAALAPDAGVEESVLAALRALARG